ncbi:uncharacterized protein LOC122246930 [Penaeus japonicus]|uniref:uncharacterized protein LOC122246930 n=1 Tax=Penaeus japonicus TaxID=27405 RepID=UPI001C70C226|nr:uncharacterized protein LOC122246930 [Penaeus japonicus]
MPFGGRQSERYELNGTGQLQRDRTYGSIVRDRTYTSIGSYANVDPEAHCNFINEDDLDFQHGDGDSWRSSGGLGSNRNASRPQEDATTFFRDGRRRIDYVLVYEDSGGASRRTKEEREKSLGRTLSASEKRTFKHESWRHRFMNSLMKAGLHMEEVRNSRESEYSVKTWRQRRDVHQ